MEETDIRKTKAKCPKCKSKSLNITEHCIHTQTWNQENGYLNHNDGIMNPGDVVGCYGECDECGHQWKFKNLQIIELYI